MRGGFGNGTSQGSGIVVSGRQRRNQVLRIELQVPRPVPRPPAGVPRDTVFIEPGLKCLDEGRWACESVVTAVDLM